jgi:L-amino acid N-acyltransferase YncA
MIIVRKATRDDISTIVKFQQKMARETESIHLDFLVVRNGVVHVFDFPENGFYLVATENDVVVGSMLLTPEWSDWRNATWLWIQSVYVDPEHREKGAFKQLYLYIQNVVLHSKQYAGLKLYVDKENKKAQGVYKKMGMALSHYQLFEWSL